MRFAPSAALAAAVVLCSHAALAQDETPADTPPEEAPRPEKKFRDHGLRLGLELGFDRSLGGSESRVNAFTPSLIPVGADVSVRVSRSALLGLHGFAALASRTDCTDNDSCRARAYGFGAHVEATPIRRENYSGYLRYGMGYEILYHGGMPADADGHENRGAFDIIDLRVGADFVVHRGPARKTARIGPYLGFVVGMLAHDSGVVNYSRVSEQMDKAEALTVSSWFQIGVRGTLDP